MQLKILNERNAITSAISFDTPNYYSVKRIIETYEDCKKAHPDWSISKIALMISSGRKIINAGVDAIANIIKRKI